MVFFEFTECILDERTFTTIILVARLEVELDIWFTEESTLIVPFKGTLVGVAFSINPDEGIAMAEFG